VAGAPAGPIESAAAISRAAAEAGARSAEDPTGSTDPPHARAAIAAPRACDRAEGSAAAVAVVASAAAVVVEGSAAAAAARDAEAGGGGGAGKEDEAWGERVWWVFSRSTVSRGAAGRRTARR